MQAIKCVVVGDGYVYIFSNRIKKMGRKVVITKGNNKQVKPINDDDELLPQWLSLSLACSPRNCKSPFLNVFHEFTTPVSSLKMFFTFYR